MATSKKSGADALLGQAVGAFEKAIKVFGREDFAKAKDAFTDLTDRFPDQRDVCDRARAYIAICDRRLHARAPKPKEFDDMVLHGVYLHNRGEHAAALKQLQQAAEIHPRNEHVLYCIAATSARNGDRDGALKALKSAITANAENRAQARFDSDFDSLHDDQDFLDLLQSPDA